MRFQLRLGLSRVKEIRDQLMNYQKCRRFAKTAFLSLFSLLFLSNSSIFLINETEKSLIDFLTKGKAEKRGGKDCNNVRFIWCLE